MAKASTTLNPLHFEDLEPHRFEDLVRQLAYDFRNWSHLEAVGRSGRDEGIDIRGVEIVGDYFEETIVRDEQADDQDGIARDELPQERTWLIQCKRYKKLTPKQVKNVVEDNLSSQEEKPYGYMLVAACDFSEAARRQFRQSVVGQGVHEGRIIGKGELEDLLFRPHHDHLLFAYFGISIQVKRKSSRTRLRSNIALKKSLVKLLGGFHQSNQEAVLLRDPDDKDYPYIEDEDSFRKKPLWDYWEFFGHSPPNYLMFIKKRQFAYFDEETREWDRIEDLDINQIHKELFDHPLESEDGHDAESEARDVWRTGIPSRNQAYFFEMALIPYDRILAVDELGDSYNKGPHLFVDFRAPGEPFEAETKLVVRKKNLRSQYYRVSPETRTSALRDAQASFRKEREGKSQDEIEAALRQRLSKLRGKFIKSNANFLSNWYSDVAKSTIKRNAKHTLELGEDNVRDLKGKISSLQKNSLKIAKDHLDVDELWFDTNSEQSNFSLHGNRMPEHLTDRIRKSTEHLGEILNEFGYVEIDSSWGSERSEYRSSETSLSYKYNLDWSPEMKEVIDEYSRVLEQLKTLTRAGLTTAQNSEDPDKQEAVNLWEDL